MSVAPTSPEIAAIKCKNFLASNILRSDNPDGDKTQDYYFSFIFHLRSIPRHADFPGNLFSRQPFGGRNFFGHNINAGGADRA